MMRKSKQCPVGLVCVYEFPVIRFDFVGFRRVGQSLGKAVGFLCVPAALIGFDCSQILVLAILIPVIVNVQQ